ncbi:MAG: glycosyl transferase family 9 [Firmicutes bacterium]|nr:glycosyl transferase family 9 [Bacillota bacterium]
MERGFLQERGNRILKLLDYYIGIPLTVLIGYIVPKKSKVPRICEESPCFALLKTAAIGDTVLLSAIVSEIRARYPDAVITIVCTSNNRDAASLINGVNYVHVFNLKSPIASFMELRKISKQDVVLDFAPWARINSLISFFIRGRFKVGFKRKSQYRHYLYDKAVDHLDDLHELDNYRNLLKATEIEPRGINPIIRPGDGAIKINASQMIILHPFPAGSGKNLKEWPLERWFELGCELSTNGFEVAISGGKDDVDRAQMLVDRILQAGGKTVLLAGQYSLAEFCDVLRQAEILVSVNTGIMHLGAALNIPLVALHGPTSPKRWGPLGKDTRVIVPTKPCAPCISLGFEYKCVEGGCMHTISVEKVKKAVYELLNRQK